MKKALLVLIAVLFVAGSVFAQSAAETKTSSGPDELTYWASLNAAITANSFDELPYWQELMARTNTKVSFQHVAANNNVAEAFAVLTASRRSMPDALDRCCTNALDSCKTIDELTVDDIEVDI